MANTITKALECVTNANAYFYKYLTSNDVGSNGSHQYGVYIRKDDGKKLFPKPFKKGENVPVDIKISWYDSKLSEVCNFIYYGKALRTDEFRITRINRKFQDGDFFLLALVGEEYIGFVLNNEQSKDFLALVTNVK